MYANLLLIFIDLKRPISANILKKIGDLWELIGWTLLFLTMFYKKFILFLNLHVFMRIYCGTRSVWRLEWHLWLGISFICFDYWLLISLFNVLCALHLTWLQFKSFIYVGLRGLLRSVETVACLLQDCLNISYQGHGPLWLRIFRFDNTVKQPNNLHRDCITCMTWQRIVGFWSRCFSRIWT